MKNFEKLTPGEPTATLHTTMGDITVRFFGEHAPKAVENFLTHAGQGYYDGVIFHRVIKGFMIQSGDPQGTGMGGESIWGRTFKNEVSEECRNFRGALAMANAGPDTNGSQFYIVQAGAQELSEGALRMAAARTGMKMTDDVKAKYLEVGGAPWLDGGYSVFGEVISGMDVVDKIAAVKVGPGDRPVAEIKIESIAVAKAE